RDSSASAHRDDQFMHGVAFRSRDPNMDTGPMEYHRLLWFVDQKIEEAQRLRLRLQGREALRTVGIGSFVRRQELYTQSALAYVVRRESGVGDMWDLAKCLIDRL